MTTALPQTVLTALQLDLVGLEQGTALVVVGLLLMLLWAGVQFRNPAALVMWGLSVLTLVVSFMFDLSDELFWFTVIGTVILIIVGVAARMLQG